MIIALLYSLLFFFTPIIYTSNNSEFFELPKMYFVYSLTIAIVFTHLINVIKGSAPLFRRSIYTAPLLVFILFQFVSTLFSIDVHTSLYGYYSRLNGGLLSLIAYSCLYLVLVVYVNDSLKKKIIFSSLVSGLIVASYGIAEHFGIDKDIWVQDVEARVFSTLGQPNWLAAYLCILLPFSVDGIIISKKTLPRAFYALSSIIFYLCLLYTKSKSGIIAALISIGILGLIYFVKNIRRPLLVSGFLFLAALSLLIPNPIKDIIFPAPVRNSELEIGNSLNITPSGDIRKIVWQGSLELWRQFPLFGTGPETFAYSYYWTRPISHNLTSEWNFLYNKAHNEFLNYMATTGTFGIISYLVLIVVSLYQIAKSGDKHKLAILTGFFSILITNGAGFSVVLVSLYFFLLPALVFTPNVHQPKFSIYLLPLAFVFPFLIFIFFKTTYYYLADITYAQALNFDQKQDYNSAYSRIQTSIYYRPNEPIYLSKTADILAKLAIVASSNKQPDKSQKYTQLAIDHLDYATSISPFSLNLWKEKAQTFYYLSSIDSKYYLLALDSLTKATRLAPTDAMSFYLLGKFYQNVAATDQALQNYQQAFKLKPNYDYASFAIGKIYFDDKEYIKAKPYLETTLQIAPGNTDAQDYLNIIATSSARHP